jgi:hypothetical protein
VRPDSCYTSILILSPFAWTLTPHRDSTVEEALPEGYFEDLEASVWGGAYDSGIWQWAFVGLSTAMRQLISSRYDG